LSSLRVEVVAQPHVPQRAPSRVNNLLGPLTYISALLDQGVDRLVTSELAAHSSPTTTERYDGRGERARRATAETIVVP
jgi:hypothetical protein